MKLKKFTKLKAAYGNLVSGKSVKDIQESVKADLTEFINANAPSVK